MEVTIDIYDISRRIREGDESGWRGDPTASVMFNPLTQQFEVWLIHDHNTPYIACSAPRQAQEARLSADRDRAEEIADKMHFAIIKDLGHLEGGTRRQYSMNSNKK